MTREDIIRMAREAGFPDYAMGLASEDAWQKTERFAALVAAAEREACAKIIYGLCISDNNAQEIVNAIRARGGK
jgi:uncharacterized protein YdhG (YjbR/CyaY superfamily)